MQNQEQSSSRSSSPNQDRTNKLLQKYANTNFDALPASIIQELEEENFLGVDISGAMNLTDISALPEAYRKETLVQSIELEIEPFVNEKAQELLGTIGRITHEMVANDFIHQITDIANEEFDEVLPEYFEKRYESLVKKCRQAINHPVCLDSTNRDLLDNNSRNEMVNNVIDEAIDLNKRCLSYKMRWQIIKNVQNIRFHGENVLKIPVDYSSGLPVYLYLLSELKENFTIETVDVNGTSVDNTVMTLESDLVRFGLREPEGRHATNIRSVHPIIDHALSDVENENEDPGTGGSRDSMEVNPGTDHDPSDVEEGGNNRRQAAFRRVGRMGAQLAAFDQSRLEQGVFGTNGLSPPDAESLIIAPTFYGPKK